MGMLKLIIHTFQVWSKVIDYQLNHSNHLYNTQRHQQFQMVPQQRQRHGRVVLTPCHRGKDVL